MLGFVRQPNPQIQVFFISLRILSQTSIYICGSSVRIPGCTFYTPDFSTLHSGHVTESGIVVGNSLAYQHFSGALTPLGLEFVTVIVISGQSVSLA